MEANLVNKMILSKQENHKVYQKRKIINWCLEDQGNLAIRNRKKGLVCSVLAGQAWGIVCLFLASIKKLTTWCSPATSVSDKVEICWSPELAGNSTFLFKEFQFVRDPILKNNQVQSQRLRPRLLLLTSTYVHTCAHTYKHLYTHHTYRYTYTHIQTQYKQRIILKWFTRGKMFLKTWKYGKWEIAQCVRAFLQAWGSDLYS